MVKKRASGNIFGLGGEYEQIDTFPRTIKKGELLVHEKKCKDSIKYLSFYIDSEGDQKFTINEVIT